MFLITGDKHGDFTSIYSMIELMELTEKDTILVLGDMGLFWRNDMKDAKATIEAYEANYAANLWFIDGNHENFRALASMEDENGYVSPHIRHLKRGTTFEVDGKRCLCMGGADSVDKYRRERNLSWWEEEQITEDDIKGIEGEFDYVFTHAAPLTIVNEHKAILCQLALDEDTIDHTSEINLDKLMNQITFHNWWFGHYHQNLCLDSKFRCLYNDWRPISYDR